MEGYETSRLPPLKCSALRNTLHNSRMVSQLRGLALEGGGVTGIAHVGVIKILDDMGILSKLTHFAGSSAGSLVTVLLACRVPYDKIREINLNLNFKEFEDSSWLAIKDVYNLVNYFGWNTGDAVIKIVGDILEKYVGLRTITLGQIKEKFGTTLIITATDMGIQNTIYYTPDTHPDIQVVEVARQSTSIPLFYCPVTKGGHMYVDGGLLDNYPIRKLYEYLPPEQVFGVMLRSTKDGSKRQPATLPQNIIEFTKIIITMLHDKASHVHVEQADWERTIRVNVGTISSTDFNLTDEQKLWLMAQGEDATKKFFDTT